MRSTERDSKYFARIEAKTVGRKKSPPTSALEQTHWPGREGEWDAFLMVRNIGISKGS